MENQTEVFVKALTDATDQIVKIARKRNTNLEDIVNNLIPLTQQFLFALQELTKHEVSSYYDEIWDTLEKYHKTMEYVNRKIHSAFDWHSIGQTGILTNLYDTALEFSRVIEKKLIDSRRPQHQKITSQGEEPDRNRYLVAADYLEDHNASDYLITIHRTIGNGQRQNVFMIRNTMDFDGNLDDQLIRLMPISIMGSYQKILGIRKYYELPIRIFKNQLPLRGIHEIILKSRFMPNVQDPQDEKEVLEVGKDICTRSNKGDGDFWSPFIERYLKKMVDSSHLIASRSRTRIPMDHNEEEYQRQILQKVFSLLK